MRAARWSVAQGMLRTGALLSDVALAAEVGFDGIGLELPSVLAEGAAAVRAVLDDHGLVASSLINLPVLLDATTEAHDRFVGAVEAAAMVGSAALLVSTGSLGRRLAPEADHDVVQRLTELGARAADRGVVVLLEPIHPLLRGWSYVHAIDHAARLVEAAGPGVGVAVDTAHLWWDPDLPFSFAEHLELIHLVQLADVPTAALDAMRYERAALGTGDVPVAELIREFHAAGYHGTYECEILTRMPSTERPSFLRGTRTWLDTVDLDR